MAPSLYRDKRSGEVVAAMQLDRDTSVEQGGLPPERGLPGAWVVIDGGLIRIERRASFADRYVRV